MTQDEKIASLAELFEVDATEIAAARELETLHWDSMAMLSLIAMVSEKCGKRLTGAELKKMKTIQDILNVMNES